MSDIFLNKGKLDKIMGKVVWIGLGVVIGVIVLILGIIFLAGYFSKDSLGCPIGGLPGYEDSIILKMIEPGKMAGGEGIGEESYSFRDGKKQSLCCYDVKDSTDKRYKLCDYADSKNQSVYYDVLYEYKTGEFIKTRETLPQYGALCYYYYDEKGDISGRYCAPKTEPVQEQPEPTSLNDCKQITEPNSQDQCYKKIAVKEGDKSICNLYNNLEFKPICLLEVACVTGDESICTEKGVFESGCYKCVAIKNNDGTLCTKVGDASMRESCFSNFKDINFNPDSIFTINKLSCTEDSTSIELTPTQNLELFGFSIYFNNPTQSFSISNSYDKIQMPSKINQGYSYQVENSKYYFNGPADSIRIAFTIDTGDYSTSIINC